jgi:hypothetical protein
MLNGRIYRAALLPLLVAIAVVALSLGSRPSALSPTVAPEAFDGGWASQELASLAAAFPERSPGSRGDERLAWQVAHTIEAAGAPANGGFQVRVHRFGAPTNAGDRSLLTVIASRAGSTAESPIVVVAHRDSAHARARAELSATAALLELARVFANEQTTRPVVLVSTSGGSDGDAGAADAVSLLERSQAQAGAAGARSAPGAGGAPGGEASGGRPADAAIVLGDLASAASRTPVVLPWSGGGGGAPSQLSETAAAAIAQQAGIAHALPGLTDQLVHLALPEAAGEEGVFGAAGIPAIMVQASGESGPAPGAPVSAARLEAMGSAVLATINALDAARGLPAPQSGIAVGGRILPGWALRMLVAGLLLPSLLVTCDAVARARRRSEAIARRLVFTAACGLPFLAFALLVRIVGLAGLAGGGAGMGAAPGGAGAGVQTLLTGILALLVFAIAWRYWLALVRVLHVDEPPRGPAAGAALLVVLQCTLVATWLWNPAAALLAVPAAHLWLLVAAPELRPPRRPVAVAVVLLGVCGPLLAGVYLAHQLGLSVVGLVPAIVLQLAGGHIGAMGIVLGALGLGCTASALLVALCGSGVTRARVEPAEITIRGPLSYAGPGSLGGTESALRR